MTEALASKTCTPCRGGIPPLAREQAELFHGQAPDWQLVEELTASSGAPGFAISVRHSLLFRRLANSRKLNAIIRTSASVGAMRRSRCRPRRSRVCMRTTSSWPPRSTAYSLARPPRERVLLQFAALFRCKAEGRREVSSVPAGTARARQQNGIAERGNLALKIIWPKGTPAKSVGLSRRGIMRMPGLACGVSNCNNSHLVGALK